MCRSFKLSHWMRIRRLNSRRANCISQGQSAFNSATSPLESSFSDQSKRISLDPITCLLYTSQPQGSPRRSFDRSRFRPRFRIRDESEKRLGKYWSRSALRGGVALGHQWPLWIPSRRAAIPERRASSRLGICRLSADDSLPRAHPPQHLRTLTPVSYTHLDVYKRQVIRQSKSEVQSPAAVRRAITRNYPQLRRVLRECPHKSPHNRFFLRFIGE